MNLRITVPVRGLLSLEYALYILAVNIIVPGLGTILLACLLKERNYLSQTATPPAISQTATTTVNTKQEHDIDHEAKELVAKVKLRVQRYRKHILLVGLLQFISVALLLAGWLWALIISLQLIRDARIYKK